MVYVRLERSWTEPDGACHDAGAMVDVDAGVLATLQANGTVTEPGEDPDEADTDGGGWAGPDDDDPDPDPDGGGWAGPDGGSGGGSG